MTTISEPLAKMDFKGSDGENNALFIDRSDFDLDTTNAIYNGDSWLQSEYYTETEMGYIKVYHSPMYRSDFCDYQECGYKKRSIESPENPDESGEPVNKKRKRKRVLNYVQRIEATKREKKRMLKLNVAFEQLRSVLPLPSFARAKLSRVETLRSAIDYIRSMIEILETEDQSQLVVSMMDNNGYYDQYDQVNHYVQF
ncbi:hypothetical protein ACOME3_006935 [Neoechinorhynchus agilis]